MKRYGNLEEIIDLLKEEIENNDENISATLDLEDLKELKEILDANNVITEEDWKEAVDHTKEMYCMGASLGPTGMFYVMG